VSIPKQADAEHALQAYHGLIFSKLARWPATPANCWISPITFASTARTLISLHESIDRRPLRGGFHTMIAAMAQWERGGDFGTGGGIPFGSGRSWKTHCGAGAFWLPVGETVN